MTGSLSSLDGDSDGTGDPDRAENTESTDGDPPGGGAAPGGRRGAALIAVCDPKLRRSLSAELAGRVAWTCVEAGSPGEAERLAVEHAPGDLAVVDAALGAHGERTGADGLVQLVATLRRLGWAHVVALGERGGPERIGAALSAGARAYLFRGEQPETGPEPAHDGQRAAGGRGRRLRVRDAGGRPRDLSDREVEVVRLTAEGLTNPEIGHVLGLSALTVKSHLARISQRLGARDRAHMVLLALRAGTIR
ncbi:MAG TPA: response regulator transcription factor [Pseudonocardia sp.]|nr:response regulator transcription factor [Pseudonocardia sp.]